MQTTRVTYEDECKPQGLHRLRLKKHPTVYKPSCSSSTLPKRLRGHRPAPAYNSRHTGPPTPCYRTEANSRPSWCGLTAASTCSHGTRPSAGLSSPCCLPEMLWATTFDEDRDPYGQDACSLVMTSCLFQQVCDALPQSMGVMLPQLVRKHLSELGSSAENEERKQAHPPVTDS